MARRNAPHEWSLAPRHHDALFWKSKGHINSARRRFGILSPSSCDNDKLSAFYLIRDGSRVARERQCRLPEQIARGLIKCTKLLIEVCGSDEHQPACCYDRATIILSPGILLSLSGKLGILAQRNL